MAAIAGAPVTMAAIAGAPVAMAVIAGDGMMVGADEDSADEVKTPLRLIHEAEVPNPLRVAAEQHDERVAALTDPSYVTSDSAAATRAVPTSAEPRDVAAAAAVDDAQQLGARPQGLRAAVGLG